MVRAHLAAQGCMRSRKRYPKSIQTLPVGFTAPCSTVHVVKAIALLLLSLPATMVLAEPLIPTAPGTNWAYHMSQKLGEGVSIPGAAADASSIIRAEVVYRLEGSEIIDGNSFLKFEMHRENTVT